jgi:O-antigen/teichoic acid export membrane protein
MSTIRRQSIISSGIVYFGFVLGFLNTYLFTRQNGGFTPEQYGLVGIFTAIASIMLSFANFGMISFIHKFYPYYKDNLAARKNDMMTVALLTSLAGFGLVMIAGLIFKSFVIRKFGAHSAELVAYYYWIFPFGLGLTFYSLFEAYAWQWRRSVLTNYFKEVQFRIFTLVLLLLFYAGFLRNFDMFIKLYAFTYILLALMLIIWMKSTGQLYFPMPPSRVTKKFLPKIRSLAVLAWSGGLVFIISNFFAHIVIAAVVPGGLASVGIYTLATYIGSIMQAPQRTIIAASLGPLSRAWKDKDLGKIDLIYRRSSINQFIFSIGIFILVWVNFTDGVTAFHLQSIYLDARHVFLFVGLRLIVDMGTGVNGQIIATSTFWRFDFFSGMLLVILTLPLNYILARKFGAVGPAIADLITFSIYNGVRCLFLYLKFGMQPFTWKTFKVLILALGIYLICHFLLIGFHGLTGIFLRSIVFIVLYIMGVIQGNISEDVLPIWATVKKRWGRLWDPRIRD